MSSSSLDLQDDPDARTYAYSDSELMKRMVKYLLVYRKHLVIVAILVSGTIITSIWMPFVLQEAIDVIFPMKDLDILLATMLFYIILEIIAWLTTYGASYALALMGQKAVYEIRQDLFKHLQNLSQDFYDTSTSGRIISRITSDIDRMSEFMSGGLFDSIAQAFVVGAIGITILTVNIKLATVSLIIIPLLLFSTYFFRRKIREAYRSTRKTISIVTSNLAESISGAKVTKTFAREDVNIERFDEVNRADYESNVEAGRAISGFFPTIRFIGLGLGVFLILYVGFLDPAISLGTIVLFLRFNEMFFRPILIIASFYATIQSAFAGAERVFTVLDLKPTIFDDPDATEMPEIKGHIQYNNVTFGYKLGVPVLKDFNLEIQSGETIALVGDTGAGKTTVVNLLNRFYDVWAGSIEIDGIDIRTVTQESLHEKIGLVLQEPFLFMGSVFENIEYGRPGASREDIENATEDIGAKRLIDSLENGFDTEVGERGSRLSEGERQLVSFARALLANPKILVLDEATSSIDIYTEHAIQRGMKKLLQGRTSIVVAHRLSTIVNADRIVVLEKGKIVEQGRHTDLMAKKGKYYSLYELQIKPRAFLRRRQETPTVR
jgi:ABC-type multidrug transport system fused ATPase/permease subunit